MSYTLQLVDENDNILWDFTSPTGTNTLHGLKTHAYEIDYGSPSGNPSFFSSSVVPGGSLVTSQDELVTMTWKQGWQATGLTIDQERAAVAEMFRLIQKGGTLKEVGGSETPRYIDFEFAPPSAMLRGQSIGANKLFSQQLDPDGMPVQVVRQPYFRRAAVSSSNQRLINGSLVIDSNNDGRPNSWTWESTSGLSAESIDPATESYQFSSTSTSTIALQSNSVAATPGQVWFASYDFYGDTGNAQSRIILSFYDAGDVIISSVNGTLTAGTGEDVTLSVSGTAPANTAFARARISRINVSGSTSVYRFRRAVLSLGALSFITAPGTVANDPGLTTGAGRAFPVFIQGSAPAPVSFTVTPQDAASKLQTLLLGVRSSDGETGNGHLSDYLNTTKVYQCESGTLGTSTTSVVVAGTSGGSVARFTPGGAGVFATARRVRTVQTTKLDSLRGWHNVYLRCKASAASRWGLTLKWGPSTANPAPNAEAEVIHDTNINGLATFGFVEIFLGQIYIPESGDLSGVSFEIWVSRYSTSDPANLDMDFISLVPADLTSSVNVPYGSRISILGKDMAAADSSGTPAAVGSSVVLNQDGIAGIDMGTPAAGRYRATFRYSVELATASTDIELAARSYVGAYGILSNPGTAVTSHRLLDPDDGTYLAYAIEWDADGSTKYKVDAQVGNQASAIFTFHRLDVERLPYVAQNEQVYTDPNVENAAIVKRDSSGNLVLRMGTQGPPVFWLNPGLNIVHMSAFEPVTGGLYSELASDISRLYTVAYSYSPRDIA